MIKIADMATTHLLSTIHMIERNRMQNLMSIAERANDELTSYYSQWPPAYDELIAEAERRMLIHRGPQQPGLVKRRK